jgi:uncharacterized membrane protein
MKTNTLTPDRFHKLAAKESDGAQRSSGMRRTLKNPLVRAGIVLGLGFGGFADGIVLHQILGWHHLVCVTAHCQPTSIKQLQLQNTQDGFFHLALWLVSLVGTTMLFRAARHAGPAWNGRVLFGSMLAGCGLFNFVEGIIDHQMLGIHHVLPGHPHQLLFDMLWLANGVLFLMIGAWLIRSPRSATD